MFKTIRSLLLLCSFATFAQAPFLQWQKSLGGTDQDRFKAVKQTADGGFIAVGGARSTDHDVIGVHFDEANYPTLDYWVVKFDESGAVEWKKVLGGSVTDEGVDVSIGTDGKYLIVGYGGSIDGDVDDATNVGSWIIKLDTDGTILWKKVIHAPFGGCCIFGTRACAATPDNGFVMATYGNFPNGLGDYDGLVTKINASGDIEWQQIVGYAELDQPNAIITTSDGGYALCGTTAHILGNATGFSNWVVKLNASGETEWDRIYGGSGMDQGFAMQQTGDGGFIIAGYTDSNNGDVIGYHGQTFGDAWILRLNVSGDILWQRSVGGTHSDQAYDVIIENNEFVVAGFTRSVDGDLTGTAAMGYDDAWIFKLDDTGNILWQKELGGTQLDGFYGIDIVADGGYMAVGETFSNDGQVGPVDYNIGFSNALIAKFTKDFLSAPDFEKASFVLYPNPAKTVLNIQVSETIRSVIITDVTGKNILSQSQPCNSVTIENFAAGIYLIKVITDNATFKGKFVKE